MDIESKFSVKVRDDFTDAIRILRNIHILCNCAADNTGESEAICDTVSDLLYKIVIPNLERVEEIIDATP